MGSVELARIAVRHTFAARRGQLSVFMSTLAIIGLVLAIALLLTVLSVMNGFDREMRERILSLVPHIIVHAALGDRDPATLAATLREHPAVLAATPFVAFEGLALAEGSVEAVAGLGLEPAALAEFAALGLDGSAVGGEGLYLGAAVARRLGAVPGTSITLLVPARDGEGPPETAAYPLVGIIATGTELDEGLAALPLPAASDLAGLHGSASGLRLHTIDLFDVARVRQELLPLLPPGYYLTDWTLTHGNLYEAIQLSRRLITVLLLSIIAVAAFNVVSSLVLVVMDKRGSIAILRTLGATPTQVGVLFLMQGGMIGVTGVVLGGALGLLASLAVPWLVAALEGALGVSLLATDVYPVSFIPSDVRVSDFAVVAATALFMCLCAACYPALRAARLAPAAVLQADH
ncbi:FtsX-like permease family protein [Pseudohaliea rubra]|uniref:Lipoprotein releasing system transmembrane protein LolC n=1 Tax=Pseudohaliea rubra DSM 19751 TaxID=1265313 RepID=A0A095VQF3_9GAMM|nr:FtsX-like permease family protein [Pseudohaliea rubra]KGE03358.1 Lipoprotein releasing system transmembrane protein LolC [Pseudohaliea rubra DSM 19751]